MTAFAPALLDGVLIGGVYALLALGLTLIHLVLRLVNLAHGSLVLLAMAGAWGLAARFDIDPYASLPLLTLLMFGIGWGLHRTMVGPAMSFGGGGLATLGIGLAIDRVAVLLLPGPPRIFAAPYATAVLGQGPASVAVTKLAGFGIAAALVAGLWLFVTQTDTGRSVRAVALQPEGARLVGLRPERIQALAFGVGTACLGAAACLLLPVRPLGPQLGPVFLLVSVTAAVLGGLGSFTGAVLGGLLVGVVESLVQAALGEAAALAALAVLLAAVLLVRPRGLFGRGRMGDA